MRVLFINNFYRQKGGEEVVFEQEVSLLQEKGHATETLTFHNLLESQLSTLKAGWQSIYNPGSARKLKKAILTFKPDVIHVHNLFYTASPAILYVAARYHIPVMLTVHNFRLICANALLLRNNEPCELCIHQTLPLHAIRYKCFRNSRSASAMVTAITGIHKLLHTWQQKIHTYISLNEFSKNRLLHSSLNIPENKVVIKPNFIEDPGEGGWPRKKFFLYVGRISPEKGVPVLLEAFATLPEHQLYIIGDGPDKTRLEYQYRDHQHIRFLGNRGKAEVWENLKQCAALIVPSVCYEGGLPLTVIEAFATGTPVIASRLGAMAEEISDGENGLHFIKGNIRDLQHKITYFADIATRQQYLYRNARQTYLDKYHPDVHYVTILKIYETALAGRQSNV